MSFAIEYNPSADERSTKSAEQVLDEVIALCKTKYDKLVEIIPDADFRNIERRIFLYTIDQHWKENLYAMDQLKDAIRYQGYAQKDPLVMYKNQAFVTFQKCLESIASVTAQRILNIRIQLPNGISVSPEQLQKAPRPQPIPANAEKPADAAETTAKETAAEQTENAEAPKAVDPVPQAPTSSAIPSSALPGTRPQGMRRTLPGARTVKNDHPKLGRNDLCWCGSGLKYKKCHGKDEV